MKAGISKLRGIRRRCKQEHAPLCMGNEDVKHTLLSCPETKKWRMQIMNIYGLSINERAFRKITNCKNELHIMTLWEYFDKIGHK
jgi:hypothetical protein